MITEAAFCVAIQYNRIVWQKLDKLRIINVPCLIYNANYVPVLEGMVRQCPAEAKNCEISKKAHDK